MEDDDLIFLRFKQDEIRAEYRYNSRKHIKYLSLADLATMLAKDIKLDTEILNLGGSNYQGVRRYIKEGSMEFIFLEAGPHTRNLKYRIRNADGEGSQNIDVPTALPTIFMALSIENEKLKDSLLFSTRYPVVSDTIQLYKFPFGNVWEDGRICWGDNERADMGKEKFTLLNFFLESRFNNDLGFYHQGERERDINAFIDTIRDVDTFNTSHLMTLSLPGMGRTTTTFKSLIEYLEGKHVRSRTTRDNF